MTCLFNIGIDCNDMLGNRIIMDTSREIQQAVISCLKIGITKSYAGNISLYCLRFIRALLTVLSKPESSFSNILNPSHIHMMIAAHSMFESTLSLKGITSKERDLFL